MAKGKRGKGRKGKKPNNKGNDKAKNDGNESQNESQPEIQHRKPTTRHCPCRKEKKHTLSPRCITVRHIVLCSTHSPDYSKRPGGCIKCNEADKRKVRQETKERDQKRCSSA
ncbi:hypothetical protein N7457_005601 [Penicillium paradoxum]|uniref:uncharacterized protein n=1 Tax=Penicillium paradoxum TaxID=176176 RepID=UPI002548DA04|nr:uncharacterized protein N7457_005601 [Penicillium paradoxum]KAJ5780441.1 hypothetical protein N7457_005601 [Penicillium paradoxum]